MLKQVTRFCHLLFGIIQSLENMQLFASVRCSLAYFSLTYKLFINLYNNIFNKENSVFTQYRTIILSNCNIILFIEY